MSLDGEPIRVITSIKFDHIDFEKTAKTAVDSISQSSERLCAVVERLETPMKVLLICAGISSLLLSLSFLLSASTSTKVRDE